MDLYRIGNRYVGTQADARAEAKAQGVRFDPEQHAEKVPTDKAGLIDYLNALSAPSAAPDAAVPIAAAPASSGDTYHSPFSASTTIQKIDASLAASAIKQMDDPKALATIIEAAVGRFNDFRSELLTEQAA